MSKCAFISGASRGIGKGIAEVLASAGYNLAMCCVNNIDSLTDYASKLQKAFGIHAKAYKLDVSSYFDWENVSSDILSEFGNIDVVINNAGIYFYSPIENMKKDDIINSIKLNSLAPYELIKYYVPYMKKQKWGRIINIGSISGVMGEANASVYSMTKASLIGMTKSLALELAQDNITVNIINPGWVDTELINNENLEADFSKDEIIETIPQRRFVTPEEIAKTCEFLISEGAKTVTGQSVNICAGLSLGC